MPRSQLMTPDDAGKRWKKKYRLNVYTISYQKLGGSSATATQTAANAWWIAKRAEIDGQSVTENERGAAMVALLLKRAQLQGLADEGRQMLEFFTAAPEREKALPVVLDAFQTEAKRLTHQQIDVPQDQTIGHHFQAWRKRELSRGVRRAPINVSMVERFIDFIGGGVALDAINETMVGNYFDFLTASTDIDDNYKAKLWQLFKRFITELAEDGLASRPGNLDSKRFAFKVVYDAPTVWTLEEVELLKGNVNELQRLWILLMLNCGWRQVDIATLLDSEVDWTNGTITRKRGKLVKAGVKKVPTVRYFLWQETFELLKKYRSGNELVFVDDDGSPMYIDGKKDKIGRVLNATRKTLGIQEEISKLRATSASKLDAHAEFGRYVPYFLGEKPSGTAAKHYVEPSHEQFRNALTWLQNALQLTK